MFVPSNVIGPGFGARTQWARVETVPPDHGAVTDGGGLAVTVHEYAVRLTSAGAASA